MHPVNSVPHLVDDREDILGELPHHHVPRLKHDKVGRPIVRVALVPHHAHELAIDLRVLSADDDGNRVMLERGAGKFVAGTTGQWRIPRAAGVIVSGGGQLKGQEVALETLHADVHVAPATSENAVTHLGLPHAPVALLPEVSESPDVERLELVLFSATVGYTSSSYAEVIEPQAGHADVHLANSEDAHGRRPAQDVGHQTA